MLVRNSVRHAFTLIFLVLFMPDQHQSVKRMRGVFYGSIAVFAAGSCSIAFSDLIKLVCIHAETFLMDSLCSGCLVESFHPTDHITTEFFFSICAPWYFARAITKKGLFAGLNCTITRASLLLCTLSSRPKLSLLISTSFLLDFNPWFTRYPLLS